MQNHQHPLLAGIGFSLKTNSQPIQQSNKEYTKIQNKFTKTDELNKSTRVIDQPSPFCGVFKEFKSEKQEISV